MVEITSNIWGTKFKIHGLDASLPPLLGQVGLFTYLMILIVLKILTILMILIVLMMGWMMMMAMPFIFSLLLGLVDWTAQTLITFFDIFWIDLVF